jgi:hypothetical protein
MPDGFGAIRIANEDTTGSATADVAVQDGPTVEGVETMVQVMSTAAAENSTQAGATITGSGVTLFVAEPNRKNFVVQSFTIDGTGNNDIVYIGDASVSTTNGIALLDGDTYEDDRYTGIVRAITKSGETAYVRYWERT